MGFDIFQSRRNQNEFCRWWSRNEDEEVEEDELKYKRTPSGSFYASEVNAEVQDDNVVAGIIMAERTSVTIKSSDDLTSLFNAYRDVRNKVLIEYQGELWRADSVQKKKARIQHSEFGRAEYVSHTWYLSLIKG